MNGLGGDIVEVGITVGVVLAVVGIGQFAIRMYAGRKLIEEPNNTTALALLQIY